MALGAILIENQATKRKLRFLLKISTVVALNVAILNALFFFSYSNCQEMSPILLKEVIERGEDVVILDIRPQKFFDKDHIEGAISKDTLPNGLRDMNKYKDQMVVVVCGEGIISKLFCVKLNKGGFKKIYNLKGGMSTWH
jgi:rhodanese-related sulfurtransferase